MLLYRPVSIAFRQREDQYATLREPGDRDFFAEDTAC
jgi:hypothetical protein